VCTRTTQIIWHWNRWNHKTRFASHGYHEQRSSTIGKTIFYSLTHAHKYHKNFTLTLLKPQDFTHTRGYHAWAKVFEHKEKPYSIVNACIGQRYTSTQTTRFDLVDLLQNNWKWLMMMMILAVCGQVGNKQSVSK
jgi:hypothetical protein